MLSNCVSLVCAFMCVSTSYAQNCKTTGEWCADTYECCGGCCVRNVCMDTYYDCRVDEDLCLDDYCPGDSVCQIYRPSCRGCDIQRICAFLNDDSSGSRNTSNRSVKNNTNFTSSQTQLRSTKYYYLLGLIVMPFLLK